MKYFTFFKRIVTFEKYPLFRTVNFRQLLLNIFIISQLVSLPNIITLFHRAHASSAKCDIGSDVADFEIVDGEYTGEAGTLSVGDRKILFTGETTAGDTGEIDDDIFLGFLKDGIYIKDVQNSDFGYSLIGQVKD